MSKITSKIQFSSETRTDVIFGGGIGFDGKCGVIRNDRTGDKAVAVKLSLYQLCYPAAIGEPIREDDVINPRSPQVNLIFTDPRSIDAVIKALEITKEGLLRHLSLPTEKSATNAEETADAMDAQASNLDC